MDAHASRDVMATALKWLAFLAGLAFLAWIVAATDVRAVAADVARLGAAGAATMLLVFYAGFAADIGSWLCMFNSIPLSVRGYAIVGLVHYVGESVNNLMPFGSLGGEPVKAVMLKKRYGVTYREATASLVLAQANNTLAEVPFIIVGLAIMLERHVLPPLAQTAMLIGAACVGGFVAFVFLTLHLRLLASLERRLTASRWGERLHRGLMAFRDIEQQLFTMVRHEPGRFTASVVLAFVTWISGAAEFLVALRFLGADIGWQEAWLVEASVVLARNATFFVPAHMGSQDGVIVLVVSALTGSSELGLAVALIRRARELFVSAIGLALGGWLGLKPSTAAS